MTNLANIREQIDRVEARQIRLDLLSTRVEEAKVACAARLKLLNEALKVASAQRDLELQMADSEMPELLELALREVEVPRLEESREYGRGD